MSTNSNMENIRSKLEQQFAPTHLEVYDDSHEHVGHAGAQHGGHYSVVIVASAFNNKALLERHRLIYATLAEAMQSNIHALSIKALTPEEFD